MKDTVLIGFSISEFYSCSRNELMTHLYNATIKLSHFFNMEQYNTVLYGHGNHLVIYNMTCKVVQHPRIFFRNIHSITLALNLTYVLTHLNNIFLRLMTLNGTSGKLIFLICIIISLQLIELSYKTSWTLKMHALHYTDNFITALQNLFLGNKKLW